MTQVGQSAATKFCIALLLGVLGAGCAEKPAQLCPGVYRNASLSVKLTEVASVADVQGTLCVGDRCVLPRGFNIRHNTAVVSYEATTTDELRYDLVFTDMGGATLAIAQGTVTPQVTYPDGQHCGGKIEAEVTATY